MPLSPKTNLLRAIHFAEPEHVPYSGEGALRLLDCVGRCPPVEGLDEWGVAWAPLPAAYQAGAGEPAFSHPVAHPARTLAELLARPFPNPHDPALFAGLLDGVDTDAVLPVGQHPSGPLDRLGALLGPTTAWLALYQDPALGREALDRIADYHVGIAQGYVAAGVGAGWIADDYAGRDGPFLRPALWRRLVLPGLARIFDVYRTAGLPVFFHTCGRADDLLPDLLDAGATVFNLESCAADLPALRERFPRRIVFYGGAPVEVMAQGSPEDVRRAALAAMYSLGREGGLILAPDQPLAFPAENERMIAETARRFGYYPLMPAV